MNPVAGQSHEFDYGSPAAARRAGMQAAFGMPAMVLGASYLGFGAFARQSGFTLPQSLVHGVTGWALPGQIALIEIFAAGGSLLAAGVAVALANARLLPMVLTLMPILRAGESGRPVLRHYLAAHFIAITGWAISMQRTPMMPPGQRLPFFTGFTLVLWASTACTTCIGFFLVDVLPAPVTLGLVFINPLYFMLVFAGDFSRRDRALALGLGAAIGPLFHLLSSDWGLLATGLVAGSIAFLISERGRK
jgi:predicted branched-subunit amino acid permease